MRCGLDSSRAGRSNSSVAIKNTRNRHLSNTDHVYNRAKSGVMFRDDRDREWFHDALVRKLLRADGAVTLIAACLLVSHFHLVLREHLPGARASFMNGLLSSYVRYFNNRHGTSGPMFAGEYRTVPIRTKRELAWKIAYVHDNHPSGVGYRFSTHKWYLEERGPRWLAVATGLTAFGGKDEYLEYLRRRTSRKSLDTDFFD